MTQFVLNGDTVKRLLYKDPIINNNDPVDVTTQEVFKLYNGSTLLYERDRTIDNLYKVFELLEEVHNYDNKSQWQETEENGTPLGYNIAFIFGNGNYNYASMTIPVATDLITAIQNELPIKFSINQVDFGRNEFWKTVVQTLNVKTISDVVFVFKLFKDAKGLSGLNWNLIGDATNHGLVINLGSGNNHLLESAFENSDIPTVTINCQGSIKNIDNTFKDSGLVNIIFGQGIVITSLISSFEGTSLLQSITGLVLEGIADEYKNLPLEQNTIRIQKAFEGSGLGSLNSVSGNLIIYPECPRVFGNNCLLQNITGINFDFIYVDPNDFNDWNVPIAYGHPIFGNSILETINIKNLNKGNWTIPMPLDDNSVIYLLNNIYDLSKNSVDSDYAVLNGHMLGKDWIADWTKNDVEYVVYEQYDGHTFPITKYAGRDVNMRLNGPSATFDVERALAQQIGNEPAPNTSRIGLTLTWDFNNKFDNSDRPIYWPQDRNIVFSFVSDNNQTFDIRVTICYYVSYQNETQDYYSSMDYVDFLNAQSNQDYVINVKSGIWTSDTPITRIIIDFDGTSNLNPDTIHFNFKYKNEASAITSAILDLPNVNYKADFDTAIAVAQARGWTVNFHS